MQDSGNKNDAKSKVLGIIFLIWFFGSMIGFFVCSESDNKIGPLLVLFGQYFLVFGIIAVAGNLKKKPFPVIVVIFPIVGLSVLVSGIGMILGGEKVLLFLGRYAPYIFIWIFPIVGVLMIVNSFSQYRHLKRVCTRDIQAKCIDIDSRLSRNNAEQGRRRKVYMPVYSIFYNEREYIIRNYNYTNLVKFEIGMYYNIKINPSNPNEFMDENSSKANKLVFVLGIIIIVITAPIIIFMYMHGIG